MNTTMKVFTSLSKDSRMSFSYKFKLNAIELAKATGNRPAASSGWCTRFLQRNGYSIRRRTKIAQNLPKHHEDKTTNFQQFVIQSLVALHGWTEYGAINLVMSDGMEDNMLWDHRISAALVTEEDADKIVYKDNL